MLGNQRAGKAGAKDTLAAYNLSLKISCVANAVWTSILAVLLNDIIDHYALAGTQEGMMSSVVSIGALIGLLGTIVFRARLTKISIITGSGILAAVAVFAQGIPMPFMLFLGACLLLGIGNGASDSCQSSLVADLNPGDTARHMGILHGIFGIGGMLTPLALQRLLVWFSWRAVYMITGGVCFVLILQFAMVTSHGRSAVSTASYREPKLTITNAKGFFNDRQFLFLMLCVFFGAAGQSGMIVWVIRYVSVFLNDPGLAPLCLSAFWIASTISRFFSPRLPFDSRWILGAGAFIAAVTWAIALTFDHTFVICSACVLIGLASGSCIPLVISIGAEDHPGLAGFSTSILMICKTAAQTVAPIIVAFVMSLNTMRTGMYVTAMFFLLNGLFAVLMLLKKPMPL